MEEGHTSHRSTGGESKAVKRGRMEGGEMERHAKKRTIMKSARGGRPVWAAGDLPPNL